MKQLLLLLALLFASTATHAQKVTYITLGGGLSTFDFELDDLTPVPSAGISWKFYEKDGKGWSFAPALLYQQRAQRSSPAPDVEVWLRSHQLSIEAAAQYRLPAHLFFGLGYFHGLSIYDEAGAKFNGEKQKEKTELGDDIGLQLSTGADFDKFALKLSYKNGLLPVAENTYSRSFFIHLLIAI